MLLAVALAGCTERTLDSSLNYSDEILIEGVVTDEIVVKHTETKADQNAEDVTWLKGPLTEGLNITYGNLSTNSSGSRVELNKHVAKLVLQTDASDNIIYSEYTENGQTVKLAKYTFNYMVTEGGVTAGTPARWYENGPHFFEGVYVPAQLRQDSQTLPDDLTTDQSRENYTYLTHYLGMPADCQISATISRIRLPFKHRLARVLAYVLIDPEVGSGVTIRGYKGANDGGTEDPRTSEIRFNRVKVLQGVKQETNGSLTPVWSEEVRKVVPHYVGENGGITSDGVFIQGDFIMYHHKKRDTYVAPSSDDYAAAASDYATKGVNSQYERIVYQNAPCYDLIVQPSYSDKDHVMYDEEGYYNSDGSINETRRTALANTNNKIEFELTLSNGLKYEKLFQFNDLDANYQTVVYLRIKKESVDYDNSGSQKWEPTTGEDGYYGVNNTNGNSLSKVGGSWQRAFRIGSNTYTYTDGADYSGNQYLSADAWVTEFLKATESGDNHGAYFMLDSDVSITVPDGFVFTGHLDGKGHVITLSQPLSGLNGTYTTPQESDASTPVWKANVHKEGSYWVPLSGYRAEIQNTVFGGVQQLFVDNAPVSGYIYNCSLSGGTPIADNIPTSIPQY